MEISDYARALRAHLLLVLICVGAGLGLAAVSMSGAKPTYTSSESILVSGSAPTNDVNQVAANRISSYLTVARSDLVAGKVAAALAGAIPADAAYSLSATNPTGTSIIEVSTKAGGARIAQQVTTQAVKQFIAIVRGIEVKANEGGQPVSTLVPIGEAGLPLPDRTRGKLILILGAGLGLFFGVAGALLRYSLDPSVRGLDQGEQLFDVGVLGAVPRLRGASRSAGSLVAHNPSSAQSVEAFRKIATRLRHRLGEGPHRILVTSSVAGEGTSTVARNLAAALARAGVSTLLVVADPGRSYPLTLPEHGRSDLGSTPTDKPTVPSPEPVRTATESVKVIPSAAASVTPRSRRTSRNATAADSVDHPHPTTSEHDSTGARIWRPPGMGGRLQVSLPPALAQSTVIDRPDWVIDALTSSPRQPSPGAVAAIVDAGAATQSADAEIIAEHCTQVVVVVETGRTPRSLVRRTLAIFAAIDTPVIGIVLNARHRRKRAGRWVGRRPRRSHPARGRRPSIGAR